MGYFPPDPDCCTLHTPVAVHQLNYIWLYMFCHAHLDSIQTHLALHFHSFSCNYLYWLTWFSHCTLYRVNLGWLGHFFPINLNSPLLPSPSWKSSWSTTLPVRGCLSVCLSSCLCVPTGSGRFADLLGTGAASVCQAQEGRPLGSERGERGIKQPQVCHGDISLPASAAGVGFTLLTFNFQP